ncbi:MAG TPA: GTP-binding protein [Alphaproteobacteria bacterium]|jgi:flagellar biosynthesis protein FlhF|nr:GTP-binding protein [Alphaproteobacteria bacterium]
MRLKTFTARSMKQAITMVRDELGPDAVIVSTVQSRADGGTVRITAAVEQSDAPPPAATENKRAAGFERALEAVRCALEDHGTPEPVTARIVTAAHVLKGEDPRMALAAALDDCFRFAPIGEREHNRPVMLVGPPGVGKTVTAAKFAARARLKDEPVTVISADTERAGGVEQIASLAQLMRAKFRAAATPEELAQTIGDCHAGELILIDTAGTNPYSETGMDALAALVSAAKAEPVLVLNAGGDARDYAECAASFAGLGANRLVATRLDIARRLGSLLSAADAGRLRFANVSTGPQVGKGLGALNPVSLARLLLPEIASAAPPAPRKEHIA